jgi:dihydroxyacid dehydratase/phosphogluconate dehydratase
MRWNVYRYDGYFQLEASGNDSPYSFSCPATDPMKQDESSKLENLNTLLEYTNLRDIMTRDSFENAMVVLDGIGWKLTNAVLHLLKVV